jgi:hypothetical protein
LEGGGGREGAGSLLAGGVGSTLAFVALAKLRDFRLRSLVTLGMPDSSVSGLFRVKILDSSLVLPFLLLLSSSVMDEIPPLFIHFRSAVIRLYGIFL